MVLVSCFAFTSVRIQFSTVNGCIGHGLDHDLWTQSVGTIVEGSGRIIVARNVWIEKKISNRFGWSILKEHTTDESMPNVASKRSKQERSENLNSKWNNAIFFYRHHFKKISHHLSTMPRWWMANHFGHYFVAVHFVFGSNKFSNGTFNLAAIFFFASEQEKMKRICRFNRVRVKR